MTSFLDMCQLARASLFVSSDFVHEGRASNGDAHLLARRSVYCKLGRQVWFMSFISPPKGIYNYVSYKFNKRWYFPKNKICFNCSTLSLNSGYM